MVEDILEVIAVNTLALFTLAIFLTLYTYSTPNVCQVAETVLKFPGSEIHVYGRFKVWNDTKHVYLSCGLALPRDKVLQINRTEGLLRIGSTAEGKLYIS